MRQEQERFRSFGRGSAPDGLSLGVDTNPPRGWNPVYFLDKGDLYLVDIGTHNQVY